MKHTTTLLLICVMALAASVVRGHDGDELGHDGVDKASGAEAAARQLGFDLAASVGAGDTLMDTFLSTVGLAVRVGNPALPFQGRHATLDLVDSLALGEFGFRLADQVRRTAR